MRLLPLTVPLLLLLPTARAASGGPDGGDMVFTDSLEPDGPPHAWLDASGGDSRVLGDDETVVVDLPFDFEFYGVAYDQATISSNGALFFTGATSSPTGLCPGAAPGWTGIAAYWDDLAGSTVHTATFGARPARTFVVSWGNVAHATAGGNGRFQVWLLEGRNEAAIVLDDLTFGDATYDRGATATIGANSASYGLPWSCSATFADATSVWFGDQASRPARATVYSGDLDAPWVGQEDRDYSGRAIAAGDVNGDGTDEILVGSQDRDQGEVALVYRPDSPDNLGNADATFVGSSANAGHGSAIATGDNDGDGQAEIAIGASSDGGSGSGAGRVTVWGGGGFSGSYAIGDASTTWVGASTGRSALGTALALGDLDGDGYADLLMGAPSADTGGVDAGAMYLALGGSLLPPGGGIALADAAILGVASGDQFGTAIHAADLDADTRDDFAVTALYDDDGATNAGVVFVFAGSRLTGTLDADLLASSSTSTSSPNARFGGALLTADIDGSGALDFIIGASTSDGGYSDGGAAYVFSDPGISLPSTASLADGQVLGVATSANLGSALAAGDFDDDGVDDLVIAAPNMGLAASGGGVAYVFTTAPTAFMDAEDAQHALAGSGSAGAFGTALAVARNDGAPPSLFASAPYESYAVTSEGTVYRWEFAVDFQDQDGDGFVATTVGGNDCDDADATAYPGGTDTPGDSIDGDCDGWVDGAIRVQGDAEAWAWDLADIGGGDTDVYDFETYTAETEVGEYGSLSFAGTLTARSDVYGAAAVDTLAAELLPGTTNTVGIAFADGIDGLAFRLLDPNDDFTLVATNSEGAVVSTYSFALSADDRPGGRFQGFIFPDEVTTITLTGATTDGFGLDDIEVAWSDSSDRDDDGYTDADGDCEDDDDAIHPGAVEDLGNGVDDDCDGVIDAGDAIAYADAAAWESAAGVELDQIDFEDLSAGERVQTQYADLGVVFDGTPLTTSSVSDTAAHDTMAAGATVASMTLYFEEEQPAIALYLLDGDGDFTLTAYNDDILLYTTPLSPGSSDAFYGLLFDLPVDQITLTGPDSDWGVDDVSFALLGRDDADGDGLTELEGDCDDSDAATYTGAEEIWYDGLDEDCLGGDDDDADADGSDAPADCDDTDTDSYPGATESWYDGVDQDCDGASDYDADGDGHDDRSWGGEDCDDTDESISPDAEEIWYDDVDQDCAGDDDFDADGDGYPLNGALGTGDCDDGDGTVSPGAAEVFYDAIDSDCSGEEESDFDADADGYIATAWGGDDCDDTEPLAFPAATGEACYDGVDTDCDGADDNDCDGDGYAWDAMGGDDCDDTDPDLNPGATDALGDGIDTNCDGGPEYDYDGDGYDGVEAGGLDCDDLDATANPGMTEVCYDGVDADCDGWDDNDCDFDGYPSDLFGGTDCDDAIGGINPGVVDFPYDGIDSDCDGGSEYDVDGDGDATIWYGGDDCDDAEATVYPGASDACYDGVDSDCGGEDDDDCDGDGFAIDTGGGGDCDDADATVNPAASEVAADDIDQDCDGSDGESEPVSCTDCDADGYDDGIDCDDADPDVFPGATDLVYDGVDSDCDGASDYDADGDGQDAIAWGGTDCDDSNAAITPDNGIDDCGGGDEDCDAVLDEDCDLGGDSGETGDTGPDDTGPVIVDTATRDTAEEWRPDPKELAEPDIVERATNCGCSTPGNSPVGAIAGALLAGLALGRRRRA